MKKIIFSFVLLLVGNVAVNAQEKCSEEIVWCNFGNPRSEVVDIQELKKSYEVVSNDKNSVAFKSELLNTAFIYFFTKGKFDKYWVVSYDQSIKDIGKSIITLKKNWGAPIKYLADLTQVSTFKQAMLLSDRATKVVFHNKKRNVVCVYEIEHKDDSTYRTIMMTMPAKKYF